MEPLDTRTYDPLDYENLAASCVQELMRRGPYQLPIGARFDGAGVYALFYRGDFEPYRPISSSDATVPIYVGSAVSAGTRKGIIEAPDDFVAIGPVLFRRLQHHVRALTATPNLRIDDFLCRFIVVRPLWTEMVERFLITHYRPIWNLVLDGFGNHDPGAGRHQGEVPWWDAMHPGARKWAARLRQTRGEADARERLRAHLTSRENR
ncbi:MAG: Eco29kI family restriction endonuclease [Chloroflexota bacterium]|nr:MAG: Eco29kI family restriction endonuclease [Chloroflexota bacterium]